MEHDRRSGHDPATPHESPKEADPKESPSHNGRDVEDDDDELDVELVGDELEDDEELVSHTSSLQHISPALDTDGSVAPRRGLPRVAPPPSTSLYASSARLAVDADDSPTYAANHCYGTLVSRAQAPR